MKPSYWEQETWLSRVDFTVVGSGIVGLTCALRLRESFPSAKILILEKGILPQGASTKNAGFACFGSVSEILDDLNTHTKAEVVALVKQRIHGLGILRDRLGDEVIDYQELGGYEIFTEDDKDLFETCVSKLEMVNELLQPLFDAPVYAIKKAPSSFQNVLPECIYNQYEGQIDTGKMMQALIAQAQKQNIQILNSTEVQSYDETNDGVTIQTQRFTFKSKNLFIATNGFARNLEIPRVKPARAQVLVTKPVPNLEIKGTFHLDKGYYYFRNINNRILLGGGRNLDFKTEETTEFGETEIIQNKLERLLSEVILPNISYEIDSRWSGIMGVGNQKKPIVKQLSANVYCGVRLGGMGVAIGSLVGKELADMAFGNAQNPKG
ncbi:FAD-binding oxidoreductase [Dokdonia sinensis]|uniref:FAD-binding oxidoreductase n=1 Tax=Dokdonia sinensis TaxID=2479847 RepID=A0A3M0G0N8_9FLAO|nr:FAD-dependent oxidoreductase [Dokdonia sinensis]RMB58541.1 FAD-binding oxidoreductase [Dokdonia sinensis]